MEPITYERLQDLIRDNIYHYDGLPVSSSRWEPVLSFQLTLVNKTIKMFPHRSKRASLLFWSRARHHNVTYDKWIVLFDVKEPSGVLRRDGYFLYLC